MPNRVSTMAGPATPVSKFLLFIEMSSTSTLPDLSLASRMHDERCSGGDFTGPLRHLLCSVLARTQDPRLHSQLQINNLPCSRCLSSLACPDLQGVEQMSLSGNPPMPHFSPLLRGGGASTPTEGAVGASPLCPAGGQGSRLHGSALSSISAIGGGGRGAREETEGAGLWRPAELPCPAEEVAGRQSGQAVRESLARAAGGARQSAGR